MPPEPHQWSKGSDAEVDNLLQIQAARESSAHLPTSVSVWLQNGVFTDAGGVAGLYRGQGGGARHIDLRTWLQGRESARSTTEHIMKRMGKCISTFAVLNQSQTVYFLTYSDSTIYFIPS